MLGGGVNSPNSFSIGHESFSHSQLSNVNIGNYCSIGKEVLFAPLSHPTARLTTHPLTYQNHPYVFFDRDGQQWKQTVWDVEGKPVTVEHDVWIGTRSIIMAGVTIGTGAIIGSGAVVTKDVPPYAIVGGVPAKVIRYRFSQDVIEELLALRWWEYDLIGSGLSLKWKDVHTTIQQIREGIKSGQLRPWSDNDFITEKMLEPFSWHHHNLFCVTRNRVLIKLCGRWIIVWMRKRLHSSAFSRG